MAVAYIQAAGGEHVMNVGNAPAAGKRRASGAAAEDRHAETIVVVERA